jgi:CheY-like chemotaxis protein
MAKVVTFNLDGALVEGVLSKGTRRVTCQEVTGAAAVLAATRPPHLVVVSGDASSAADFAEAIIDEAALSGAPLVGWRLRGSLAETSRLVALGVRVADGDEDTLRAVCEETLDARDGRTIRVDEPATVQGTSPDVLELHGRRVIVADDDPAITWFFSDLLRAQGCDVEEAGDGAVALDVARRTMPDLVVSDIRMPGMDGVRLCRALRADPLLADVPVLLLSWKEDWLERAQEGGVEASAYLAKRSTPEEVLARVLELLGPHARLEQRLRKPGAARGSLDGTSPYRLLRLTCATHPSSRLTVRCPPRAYEVQVRQGAPEAAMCLSEDGRVIRGVPALESLLAERAGRFTLSPDDGRVDGELLGSLHQQIAACVARVRRAGMPPGPASVPAPAPVPAAPVATVSAPPVALAPTRPACVAPRLPEPRTSPMRVTLAPVVRPVPVPVRTVPLRAAPPEPVAPRQRPSGIPLRWLGVAAVAALGIVLGAGARALRHTGDAATPAHSQAPTPR